MYSFLRLSFSIVLGGSYAAAHLAAFLLQLTFLRSSSQGISDKATHTRRGSMHFSLAAGSGSVTEVKSLPDGFEKVGHSTPSCICLLARGGPVLT